LTANDPRIGTLNEDGSVQSHPSVDVLGGAYERPATTQGIGHGAFVILPAGGEFAAVVEELRAKVTPPAPVVEPKLKGKGDDAAK